MMFRNSPTDRRVDHCKSAAEHEQNECGDGESAVAFGSGGRDHSASTLSRSERIFTGSPFRPSHCLNEQQPIVLNSIHPETHFVA